MDEEIKEIIDEQCNQLPEMKGISFYGIDISDLEAAYLLKIIKILVHEETKRNEQYLKRSLF